MTNGGIPDILTTRGRSCPPALRAMPMEKKICQARTLAHAPLQETPAQHAHRMESCQHAQDSSDKDGLVRSTRGTGTGHHDQIRLSPGTDLPQGQVPPKVGLSPELGPSQRQSLDLPAHWVHKRASWEQWRKLAGTYTWPVLGGWSSVLIGHSLGRGITVTGESHKGQSTSLSSAALHLTSTARSWGLQISSKGASFYLGGQWRSKVQGLLIQLV